MSNFNALNNMFHVQKCHETFQPGSRHTRISPLSPWGRKYCWFCPLCYHSVVLVLCTDLEAKATQSILIAWAQSESRKLKLSCVFCNCAKH